MTSHQPGSHAHALLAGCILLAGCAEQPANTPAPDTNAMNEPSPALTPPVAEQRPHVVESPHGNRADHYYWLRDDDRKDPDMLAYLAAENAYTLAQLAHVKGLEDTLFDELVARIKKDDSSVPARYRGYYYYRRFETDAEYPIYARRKGSVDAPEEILLDVNRLAEGHDYFAVGDYEVSTNNKLLAWSEDTSGRRIYTIRFLNLATGELLPDALPGNTAALVWADDNRTLFYIEKDPVTLLGYRVRKHRLGDAPADDELVYEEADDTFYMDLGRTGDDRFIVMHMDSTVADEIRYLDASRPDDPFRVLLPRERDHEYEADHIGTRWIIRANWQAHNFRIVSAPDDDVENRDGWRDIVPHDPNVYIAEFDAFRDFLAIAERRDALRRVRVLSWDGEVEFAVQSDEPAFVMDIDVNPEQDTDWLRYSYSSLTTPETIYEVNTKTQERRLLKQEEVLGGFEASNYRTERLWAPARDGKRIPVSIVYRDGYRRDGTAPLYQDGYGAYGLSEDPGFDADVLSLLDRGFVYAIAHIRGGQELGRQWYEDGKLLNKMNTFTDFIDVTEFLVREKYADPDRVAAVGRSAGGLLTGAVVNLRPDLYRVVVAGVPYVDAVTTMLDESIPLTTGEFDEWGNPKEKRYYDYMLAYSPYDNVAAMDYPAMLVTTGLWDGAVQYYEPAKWVARLRELKTDDNRLLFHTHMDAGHSGQSGRFRANRELAREFVFIMDEFGLAAE